MGGGTQIVSNVYISIVSGYEDWKILGVFADDKAAFKKAKSFLKRHNKKNVGVL